MTMTETKLSDEEIQKRHEKIWQEIAEYEEAESVKSIALYAQQLALALRAYQKSKAKLQAENKALKEDKDVVVMDGLRVGPCMARSWWEDARRFRVLEAICQTGELRKVLDAALQQEKCDE